MEFFTNLVGTSCQPCNMSGKPSTFDWTVVAVWLTEGGQLMCACISDSGTPRVFVFYDLEFMPKDWVDPTPTQPSDPPTIVWEEDPATELDELKKRLGLKRTSPKKRLGMKRASPKKT